MRKCVRCNTEMNEELEIKVDMQSYGISVSRKGIFGKKIEKNILNIQKKTNILNISHRIN